MEEPAADKKDGKKKPATTDPKKDPKDSKKKGKDGKKDEEEEPPKVVPRVPVTLELLEEKSLEEFVKAVRQLQLKTPKMLLLLVSLEPAEELGQDPEEVSLKFLEDKLNQALETKIIFERRYEIPDWADKLENEYYPDETVLLFDNVSLLPFELGYETITYEGKENRYRCMYSDVQRYAKVFSQYGQIYWYDDYANFGNRYRMTNVYIRPDYFVFGKFTFERIALAAQFFKDCGERAVLILGGDMTEEKLMFLQAVRNHFWKIFVVGKLGNALAKWSSGFVPQITKPPTPLEQVYRSLLDQKKFPFSHTMITLPSDVVDSEGNALLVRQYDGQLAEKEEARLRAEKEQRDREREEQERVEREKKLREEESKKKGAKDQKPADKKGQEAPKTVADCSL